MSTLTTEKEHLFYEYIKPPLLHPESIKLSHTLQKKTTLFDVYGTEQLKSMN